MFFQAPSAFIQFNVKELNIKWDPAMAAIFPHYLFGQQAGDEHVQD